METTEAIRIDSDVLRLVKQVKPRYLTISGFVSHLLEKSVKALDAPGTLGPAKAGPSISNTSLVIKEEEERARVSNKTQSKKAPEPAWEKDIPGSLFHPTELIRDFWRTKRGSKGQRAWTLLMGQLEAIQAKYGASVAQEQLELAINGRWQSVTLANYERFKPKAKDDEFDWNSLTGISI